MVTWIKRFLFDETAFVGLVRALLQGVGAAQASGVLDLPGVPRWAGIVALALGGFIRAGEKNCLPCDPPR